MKRSDEDPRKKDRVIDLISVTKLNYRLYAVVLIVAIIVVYLVIVQYFTYGRGEGREQLSIEIIRNDAESFSDGFHPLIVFSVTAEKESVITVYIDSPVYSTRYSSGSYVSNYSTAAILPKDAFSTEFDIRAIALGSDGQSMVREMSLTTAEEPRPVFRVG